MIVARENDLQNESRRSIAFRVVVSRRTCVIRLLPLSENLGERGVKLRPLLNQRPSRWKIFCAEENRLLEHLYFFVFVFKCVSFFSFLHRWSLEQKCGVSDLSGDTIKEHDSPFFSLPTVIWKYILSKIWFLQRNWHHFDSSWRYIEEFFKSEKYKCFTLWLVTCSYTEKGIYWLLLLKKKRVRARW